MCAHDWQQAPPVARRFTSIEDLIRRTGARRDELNVLAEIGALNAFGYDRRTALWQVEQAVRPEGELFDESPEPSQGPKPDRLRQGYGESAGASAKAEAGSPEPDPVGAAYRRPSPLPPMTALERMTADYAGTGLTVGRHPMAMRRDDLAIRGVQRAVDLPRGRNGQRVRTAGMVITRQRPGTAKGFVFLTLEDETGIANIIVRPDLFAAEKTTIVGQPFLVVEGVLQNADGVTSVKAERVTPLQGLPSVESHDFS